MQITNHAHNNVAEDLHYGNHQTENVVHVECHIGNYEEDAIEGNNTMENQRPTTTNKDTDYNSVTEVQTNQTVHL